jgi:hypothetical protein
MLRVRVSKILKLFKNFFIKERINIILGAGASIDLCPSTQDLTKILLDYTRWYEPNPSVRKSGNPLDPFSFDGNVRRRTYFKSISNLLGQHFDKSSSKVNFEGLLHFASGLDRYVSSNFKSTSDLYKSEFRIPFKFRKKWEHFNLPHAHSIIASDAASLVLDSVCLPYISKSNFDSCHQVLALKKLSDDFAILQIYSLNYDCLAEKIGTSLITGFDDHKGEYSIFSPESLIANSSKSRFIQLHGSCKYALSPIDSKSNGMLTFVRYMKEDDAVEMRQNSSIGSDFAQDGTVMISPYMITGHRKADALLHEPFLSMWIDFSKRSLSTNRLVIIGYSCGDYHVNSVVKNAISVWKRKNSKLKIVFVTYVNPDLIQDKINWLHENENAELEKWKSVLMTQLRMLIDFHFEMISNKFPKRSKGTEPIIIKSDNLDLLILLEGTKQFVGDYDLVQQFLA